jgi:methylenetetrahydrofolate dehydrogenase (NADP+)/methenyltetrahydrofolate cyclohydrolase
MTAAVIDGKAIAAELRARVMKAVRGLADGHGIVPGLAVVLVGNNPASTWRSTKYARSPARSPRCPAASAR